MSDDIAESGSSVMPARLRAAGREYGAPGVVTQWTEKGKARHRVQCLRVGQMALSESMLFVLEGDYVQGFVYLEEIRQLSIEPRRSFKHPVVGTIVGAALAGAPISVILGDPLNIAGYFGGGMFPVTGGFVGLIGVYTFYEALFSRKVPWLVAQTPGGEQAFMLGETLTPQQEGLVRAMAAALQKGVEG